MSFLNGFIQWANEQLLVNDLGSSYLLARGSNPDQWRKYSIGFVPGIYDPSPEADRYHSDVCGSDDKAHWCETCKFLKWSTIWSKSEDKYVVGSRMLNSVVYPITSYSGSFIGFQIRSVVEKSYDTFVYSRRPEAFFFGAGPNIDKIWSRKSVCLVEGPSDLLTLERFTNHGVLSLNTNNANESQLRFLNRFCQKVYLFLDQDQAGRDGAISIKSKLNSDIDVRIMDYKMNGCNAKDLNDLWKQIGDVKLKRYIDSLF